MTDLWSSPVESDAEARARRAGEFFDRNFGVRVINEQGTTSINKYRTRMVENFENLISRI